MSMQTEVLMTRMAAVPTLVVAVLLAGTTGCSDGSGPGAATPPTLPGLVVSAPVPVDAVQGSLASAALAVSAGVVYVSLAPGSVPDGRLATIRNRATTQSVIAEVVDGGFDPVAIVASVGDTLAIEITRTGSVAPHTTVEVVRAARPPLVVRTDPPKKQVDVPLNAIMVIVFSAPIDATTVTTESVQLWRGTTPVAGTVRLSDATGIRAEFRPDGLLAGQTDYRLVVTQGIRDVNGEALASPLDVEFTTGVTVQVAARLAFLVDFGWPGAVDVGQPFRVRVAIEDALGNRVLSARDPVTLALDANPGAATLGGTLTVVATEGVATFTDLRIDRPGGGSGYTLAATTGTLASAVSGPLRVGDLVFTAVSAGFEHTCGVEGTGAAYCWGSGGDHEDQLGVGDTAYARVSPALVAGGLSFAAVSAGYYHTCGRMAAGAAYCWGYGGDATTYRPSPVLVVGGLSFAAVSAGYLHTCGVTTAGAAYCWAAQGGDTPGPPGVEDGLSFVAVSAGDVHTCWLTDAGAAYCPSLVAGGLVFASVSAGGTHTCGVTTSGAAYCWGSGANGQLGDGTATDRSSPVLVAGGLSFAAVSAGYLHTCGVTTAGAAYCWGNNSNGQLGDGTTLNPGRSTPGLVVGDLSFAAVSAGRFHTCAVTPAGAAWCWGANWIGQLGRPGTGSESGVPVKVAGQP